MCIPCLAAKFSIHANNGDTNKTIFAIGSSTASATTTLFRISNTGNIVQTGGANATRTYTIGTLGDATSKACYNTKNDTGADISFYFHGTAMVVEANACR